MLTPSRRLNGIISSTEPIRIRDANPNAMTRAGERCLKKFPFIGNTPFLSVLNRYCTLNTL